MVFRKETSGNFYFLRKENEERRLTQWKGRDNGLYIIYYSTLYYGGGRRWLECFYSVYTLLDIFDSLTQWQSCVDIVVTTSQIALFGYYDVQRFISWQSSVVTRLAFLLIISGCSICRDPKNNMIRERG